MNKSAVTEAGSQPPYAKVSFCLSALSLACILVAFAVKPFQGIAQYAVMPAAFAAVGLAVLGAFKGDPLARKAMIVSVIVVLLPLLILAVVVGLYMVNPSMFGVTS